MFNKIIVIPVLGPNINKTKEMYWDILSLVLNMFIFWRKYLIYIYWMNELFKLSSLSISIIFTYFSFSPFKTNFPTLTFSYSDIFTFSIFLKYKLYTKQDFILAHKHKIEKILTKQYFVWKILLRKRERAFNSQNKKI